MAAGPQGRRRRFCSALERERIPHFLSGGSGTALVVVVVILVIVIAADESLRSHMGHFTDKKEAPDIP